MGLLWLSGTMWDSLVRLCFLRVSFRGYIEGKGARVGSGVPYPDCEEHFPAAFSQVT